MKKSLPQLRRRSRGGVAVEFAVLLVTVLPVLLAGVLFFGRYFWHYTVAEKAARDAARFLAAASPSELKIQASGGGIPIVEVAKSIARTEVSELFPGTYLPEVAVLCDDLPFFAARPLPQTVTVWVNISVEDPFLGPFSSAFNGDNNLAIPIDAVARMSYVGN